MYTYSIQLDNMCVIYMKQQIIKNVWKDEACPMVEMG